MGQTIQYIKNALKHVMTARQGETILIIYDDIKEDLGSQFTEASESALLVTKAIKLRTHSTKYRFRVPSIVSKTIDTYSPQLAINLLRGPAEETPFRIKLIELETQQHRIRLGHGPGITLDMLTTGALALQPSDYRTMNQLADEVIAQTQDADTIHLMTPHGTDATFSIRGRSFFKDTIITPTMWGNLPPGEVTIGPIENSLDGQIVCDMAIGGIGLIDQKLIISCQEGRAMDIKGKREIVEKVKRAFSRDSMAQIIGEFAVGINPKARLSAEFLESEKIYGTAHVAFGRNVDYPTGGQNASANHMDFLMSAPSLTAISASRELEIIKDGKIII
jgi:aminopeptidase